MSTKIYDAYKLKDSKKDMNSIMRILQELKIDTEKNAREDIIKQLAEKVQYAKDLYKYYGNRILSEKSKFSKNHNLQMIIKYANIEKVCT